MSAGPACGTPLPGLEGRDPDEVIACVWPSPARRIFAVLCLMLLGAMLLWLGLSAASEAGLTGRLALVLGGGLSIWLGVALYRASARVLELTQRELRDSSGRVLARVENVRSVSRGVFAFKPSNGFILTLQAGAGPAHWAPGLWWRLGRRVGVGGVTVAAQTRIVADTLSALIVQQRGGS